MLVLLFEFSVQVAIPTAFRFQKYFPQIANKSPPIIHHNPFLRIPPPPLDITLAAEVTGHACAGFKQDDKQGLEHSCLWGELICGIRGFRDNGESTGVEGSIKANSRENGE